MSYSQQISIRQFDGVGFSTWRRKAASYLIVREVWTHICQKPTSQASEKKERDTEGLAMAHLEAILSEEVLGMFPQKTSYELWKALEDRYQKYDAVEVSHLESKLRKCYLQSGTDPSAYIDEMRTLFNQLALAGQEYAETKKGQFLLDGLPKEYLPFIMSFRGRRDKDDSNLEFELIARSLLHTAEDLRKAGMISEGKEKLMVTKDRANQPHVPRPGRCRNCNGRGHWAKECKKPKRYKRSEGAANAAMGNDSERGFLFNAATSKDKNTWYFDGGASYSITWDRSVFKTYVPIDRSIEIADGSQLKVCGIGEVTVTARVGGKRKEVTLQQVRHVPQANCQLLSEISLTEEGYNITKDNNELKVKRGNELYIEGTRSPGQGRLFVLNTCEVALMLEENSRKMTLVECHRALSHVHPAAIVSMIEQGRCQGITLTSKDWTTCSSCAEMKATKQAQPKLSTREVPQPGAVLSADICGPVTPATVGGAQYVSVIIDHYSSYTDTRLLKTKESSGVLQHFQEFVPKFERQTGHQVKIVRTDNGKEYTSRNFESYLSDQGIVHETTSPYNPAQNGKAERKNRTLFEAARAMIRQSGLPKTFWGEAISNACYTQNRLPHSALNGKSPVEVLSGKTPHLAHLREFGAKCWVYQESTQGKLEKKAKECTFLGYYENSKAYRVYDVKNRSLLKSIDVVFQKGSPEVFPSIDICNTVEKTTEAESHQEISLDNQAEARPKH